MDHPHLHHYTQQSDALSAQIKALKARSHAFVLGEVATFLAMIACIVFVTLTAEAQWRTLEVLLAVVFLAMYVWVRQRDTANDARIARLEDLWQVYDRECRALRGDFSGSMMDSAT
jgi:Na+-transporting NADH:ubiquinone oxidoreductase subunit NqrB